MLNNITRRSLFGLLGLLFCKPKSISSWPNTLSDTDLPIDYSRVIAHEVEHARGEGQLKIERLKETISSLKEYMTTLQRDYDCLKIERDVFMNKVPTGYKQVYRSVMHDLNSAGHNIIKVFEAVW